MIFSNQILLNEIFDVFHISFHTPLLHCKSRQMLPNLGAFNDIYEHIPESVPNFTDLQTFLYRFLYFCCHWFSETLPNKVNTLLISFLNKDYWSCYRFWSKLLILKNAIDFEEKIFMLNKHALQLNMLKIMSLTPTLKSPLFCCFCVNKYNYSAGNVYLIIKHILKKNNPVWKKKD